MNRRPRPLTFACLAPLLVTLCAPLLLAQGSGKESLVWPPVSTSVSAINGWVVVVGRTLDQSNKVVWRTPLAPAGESVSVHHGWGSLFVEVGNRQFVVDYASGRTQELRPGQIVRQDLPWLPVGTPIPGMPTGSPGAPAREYPPRTTNPAAAALPPPTLSPEAIALGQRICKANGQLIEALAALEITARNYDQKKASLADLQAAREKVRDARVVQELAQRGLLMSMPPELAKLPTSPGPAASLPPPSTAPVRPPPEDPKVTGLQKKLMELTGQYVEAREKLRLAQQQGVDSETVAARTRMADLAEQVDQTDTKLQQLRLTADAKPCPFELAPADLADVARVERKILELHEQYRQAQERMQAVQQDAAAQKAGDKELQEAQAAVVAAMKKVSAARRELEDLRVMTCRAAGGAMDLENK